MNTPGKTTFNPITLICRRLPADGMALFPFVLVRKKELAANAVLMNHEQIHLRQQAELLILPFYIAYLIHYLINRARGKDHYTAYRHIIFEQEAYANEHNLRYLQHRKFWQFLNYR